MKIQQGIIFYNRTDHIYAHDIVFMLVTLIIDNDYKDNWYGVN